MDQQLREPTRATFDGSRDWLSSLVEACDNTEQLSQVPCDAAALRAMRAWLSRPTTTTTVSPRYSRAALRYSPASWIRGS
ncbi:hypothetical protein [Tardiphaga sp.]|uniref:hypothetical protein n=1 Tax=Tardiphaga sp. TaxID=1926292 RepID=UPI0026088FDE|nr:hypothetical protein [Tardiphaga sp.]MDB5618781.1 hypothetical protein [Tardiphaga sp.]